MPDITVAPKKEKIVSLKSLKPGDCFRLTTISFEEAVTSDDGGFYQVSQAGKDKLVDVSALGQPDQTRRLPEETPVHHHALRYIVSPNE